MPFESEIRRVPGLHHLLLAGSLLFLPLVPGLLGCPEEEPPGGSGDDDAVPSDDDDETGDDDDTADDDDTGDDDDAVWFLDADGVLGQPDVQVETGEDPIEPPPDVPEVDPTEPRDFSESVEFLYDGDTPVQTGVDPATMEDHRVAVLRGRVLDVTGAGLPDVVVDVLGRPEYGSTLTRADGGYDLAVNGGELLTVRFTVDGLLPAQRKTRVPWNDFVRLADVTMIEVDPQVTTIDLSHATQMQVATGSVISDDDGTRQATVLVPPTLEATLVHADGSEEILPSMDLRLTEYTVSESGPQAMPGDLPPNSAYTYAVEVSADEALAVGADSVRFSEPLFFYVDNFLHFSIGADVPSGFFDAQRGVWVPSDNGRVVEILGEAGGLAEVDVDGSGLPATEEMLAELALTDGELQELASLFAIGDSVWRVPMAHLTPWDANWGWGPPEDAEPPDGDWEGGDDDDEGGVGPGDGGDGVPASSDDCPNPPCCLESGSIIDCASQVLGQSVGITGMPFALHYRSDRVVGTGHHLRIHLSDSEVPASLQRIELTISVAGRDFAYPFDPDPDQVVVFEWDGEDAFARPVQGAQPATVRIGYVYEGTYEPVDAFGYNGNGLEIDGDRTREEVTLWSEWPISLGSMDVSGAGLGGWSLSPHHVYDPESGILYRGDGRRESDVEVVPEVLTTLAGGGDSEPADGMVATDARLVLDRDALAVGPDGYVYFVNDEGPLGNHPHLFRVGSDGVLRLVRQLAPRAWEGCWGVREMTFTPEGTMLLVYNGALSEMAWDEGAGEFVDTVLLQSLDPIFDAFGNEIDSLSSGVVSADLAVDGSIYATAHDQVVRIGTDGLVTLVAGSPELGAGFSGDGGLAVDAQLGIAYCGGNDVLVTDAGEVFIADTDNHRIRKVTPDGIITTVAGNGLDGLAGDGGPAVDAELDTPSKLARDARGNLYVTGYSTWQDTSHHVVRQLRPNGTIHSSSGTGVAGMTDDRSPLAGAALTEPSGPVIGPDDRLLFIECIDGDGCSPRGEARIRKALFSVPNTTGNDNALVPSRDGRELYVFDEDWRHVQTLDALTGAAVYTFEYDPDGLLSTIEDYDGNVTTILRDGFGAPTGIEAPGAQLTDLELDAEGFLEIVETPATEQHRFTYLDSGLMETHTTPRGHTSVYGYNDVDLLTLATDPENNTRGLDRSYSWRGREVVVESPEGRTRLVAASADAEGDVAVTTVSSALATATRTRTIDGRIEQTLEDGTYSEVVQAPDPRWGMTSPVEEQVTVTTPIGGRFLQVDTRREIELDDPDDVLSLLSLTETVTVNGDEFVSRFDAGDLTWTTTTPEERQTTVWVDEIGRSEEVLLDPLIEPIVIERDALGRVDLVTQGDLVFDPEYDTLNRLDSITDGRGDTVWFTHDDADRVETVTLNSGHTYTLGYDDNGNLSSVTMPSGYTHDMGYTTLDQFHTYTPPGGTGTRTTQYDPDRDVEFVTLAGGRLLTFVREPDGGRLTDVSYDEADVAVTHVDATQRLDVVIRTPTGPGASQILDYGYDGSLITSVAATGAAVGEYTYAYDNDLALTSIQLESDGDTQLIDLRHDDADGLLTGYGPFTVHRDGPAGAVSEIEDGNASTTFVPDSLGRTDLRTHNVAGQEIYSIDLDFDATGRVERRVETVAGVEREHVYEYDLDGKLESVWLDNALVEAYTYDENGNRDSTLIATASYDVQDRLTSYAGTSYTFDDDGILLHRGADTFTYSARGELLEATVNGHTVTYDYDAFARRTTRTEDSGITQYLYGDLSAPFRLTATRDPDGVLTTYHYGAGGKLTALLRGDPWDQAQWFHVATDQVGTPRVVADSSGNVVKVLEYDSWGVLQYDSDPSFALEVGFAGGVADDVTGLVRFGFRDYEPGVGMWTARDPVLFGGGQLNLFAYAHSNPVNHVDPSGLVPGDPFNTPDEAAIDAIDFIFTTYADDKGVVEWGGWIHEDDGQFFATPPNRGSEGLPVVDPGPMPEGAHSLYHTHPTNRPCKETGALHSSTDTNFLLNTKGVDVLYTGTPNGMIERFEMWGLNNWIVRIP